MKTRGGGRRNTPKQIKRLKKPSCPLVGLTGEATAPTMTSLFRRSSSNGGSRSSGSGGGGSGGGGGGGGAGGGSGSGSNGGGGQLNNSRPNRQVRRLEFNQAMEDFKTMFPSMDYEVIECVLRSNNGAVDATIDQLLQMSIDGQGSDDSSDSDDSIPPEVSTKKNKSTETLLGSGDQKSVGCQSHGEIRVTSIFKDGRKYGTHLCVPTPKP